MQHVNDRYVRSEIWLFTVYQYIRLAANAYVLFRINLHDILFTISK